MFKHFLLIFIGTCCILSADLVAHYALDETDPTSPIVNDSFGNNPGTLIGSAPPTKNFVGAHGSSHNFPQRSGFSISPAPEVQPADQFTISFWFYPTSLESFDRLFETLSGTGNAGSGLRIDLGPSPGNRLRALLRDGNGSSNTTIISPLTLATGNWYFAALRYDSLNNSCALTLLQDSSTTISPADISSATTTLNALGTNAISHATGVFIAADDPNAVNSNDFGGAIDDLAFFQTGDRFGVLTDSELAQVYNIGALAFDPPSPLPTINSFTNNNPDPSSGAPFTLSWDVTGADLVEISPSIGTVSSSASLTLTSTFTQVYTLTASNAEGSTSARVQVTVDGQALAPRLSEFLARNDSFDDGDGNSSDWIEIHNPNTFPLDLSGYHLSDDPTNLTLWTFPPGSILAPNQYFLVFASGTGTPDSAGNLHTNFSLRSGGEYLAFTSPTNGIIEEFSPAYPPQLTDTSYTAAGYLALPTPRERNLGTPQQGFVADTSFNIDRGHYTVPFNLIISTPTPNAQIFYTIDGTDPSPSNGTLYTGPLNISTTTVLRAAAFRDNFLPTNIDTQSYLFLNEVINQGNTPPNTTTLWAGRLADYEMDPEVVNDPAYVNEIIPALQRFPSLSLTLDPQDFYGPRGIYQNPRSEGRDWERPVSAELISHDGSENGFQIDAGIRIQGGSSRNPDTPKHSMSLRFRNVYGAGKLNYPLFRDSPDGRDATEEFDILQLRSGYNYGWTHRHFWQANKAQYARDQFVNDLFLDMGNTGVHGRWIHLYINGIYWGIYHMHERPDQDFMESYFGGDDSDYDAINAGVANSGTIDAYDAMADVAEGNISSPTVYQTLQEHLDLPSFIDYMLINFYIGNSDWDGGNWRAAGTGPSGIPFHFIPWDSEFAISPPRVATSSISEALDIDRTNLDRNNRPTGIHQDLTRNPEYRLAFADRAHFALFNDGPLSPTGTDLTWRRRALDMEVAIVAESARWGDYRRDVQASGGWTSADYDLYTRDDDYLPIQSFILGTYLPERPNIFLDQLRARDLYPSVDAPVYDQNVNTLTMINPNPSGSIFFTTDGSDPRNPSAQTYTGPISISASATYNSRVLEGGVWSALQSVDILIGSSANSTNLVISEIFYNPPGPSEDQEFIELTNISDVQIDLSNLSFTAGITYTFPLNTTLPANAQLILTPADYTGSLDNDGETLTLVDATGAIIESFTYNDSGDWPAPPDGDGYSLVRISPASQLPGDDPNSWRPSTTLEGNPNSSDATTFPGGNSADLLAYAFGPNQLTLNQALGSVSSPRNLAADDVIYTVQTSTDLRTWINLPTPDSSSPPSNGFIFLNYQVDPAGPKRFFRTNVSLRP